MWAWEFQLPGSSAQAQLLWLRFRCSSAMWNLPRSGTEPVSPAWVDRFFSSVTRETLPWVLKDSFHHCITQKLMKLSALPASLSSDVFQFLFQNCPRSATRPLQVEGQSLPLASLRCCFLPPALCTMSVPAESSPLIWGLASLKPTQPREPVKVYSPAQPVLCTLHHPPLAREKENVTERAILVAGNRDKKRIWPWAETSS